MLSLDFKICWVCMCALSRIAAYHSTQPTTELCEECYTGMFSSDPKWNTPRRRRVFRLKDNKVVRAYNV